MKLTSICWARWPNLQVLLGNRDAIDKVLQRLVKSNQQVAWEEGRARIPGLQTVIIGYIYMPTVRIVFLITV